MYGDIASRKTGVNGRTTDGQPENTFMPPPTIVCHVIEEADRCPCDTATSESSVMIPTSVYVCVCVCLCVCVCVSDHCVDDSLFLYTTTCAVPMAETISGPSGSLKIICSFVD